MKFASLLSLTLLALGLTGCNTLNTRRDLYSPTKGSGFWTEKYKAQRHEEGIFGVSNSWHRGAGPGPGTGIFGIAQPGPKATN